MADSKIILISFSGGNTSRFMTQYIMTDSKYAEYEKIIVFANTSKEKPETLEFVNDCDKFYGWGVVWIEADIFCNGVNSFTVTDYERAKRDGEIFEQMIKHYGIPNQAFPHCSRELKELPINRYMSSLGLKPKQYLKAMGIRADEPDRVKTNHHRYKNVIYPLATDLQVYERFIIEWSARQKVQLGLKSYEGNCDWCWKKSKRKLMTIALEDPKIPVWWDKMEQKYSKGKYYFFRENKSAVQVVNEAVTTNFDKAWDKVRLIELTPELDFEKPCFCKSS